MDEAHVLSLFTKKLGVQEHSNDISELAAALEYMCLAIVQVAAYISQRAPRYSVRKYLEQFQNGDRKGTSLLNHKEVNSVGIKRLEDQRPLDFGLSITAYQFHMGIDREMSFLIMGHSIRQIASLRTRELRQIKSHSPSLMDIRSGIIFHFSAISSSFIAFSF